MNDKIVFLKGSLTFKKMPVIGTNIPKKVNFKEFYSMDKFNRLIEKSYPGDKKLELPSDIANSLDILKDNIRDHRMGLKESLESGNTYEVTFKHPKWSKFKHNDGTVFGEIKATVTSLSMKENLKTIMKEFQKRKKEYRNIKIRSKSVLIKSLQSTIKYNISAGAIYMPEQQEGVFLKFLKDEERKIVFSEKKPRETNEKYVGIELEFLCKENKNNLGGMLYDAGLGRYVTLKGDHSIKCSHGKTPSDCQEHQLTEYSHELCIIAKENEYKDIVKKACDILTNVNAIVNKTCGMHVHIDCRSRDVEKVYQNMMSSQNILLKMNPKSRIDKWARKNEERDFDEACIKTGDDARYKAINAKAYGKHGTIEIRAHAGTVDYIKITNWVELLVNIANSNTRYVRAFNLVKTFCIRFGINESLQNYIEQRITKFKIVIPENSSSDEIIPMPEEGVA